MIDEATPNLNLPLPAGSNQLSGDVERIRTALGAIDGAVAGKAETGHGHVIADVTGLSDALASKADAASLAVVAFSGDYADLTGKPAGFTGDYNDLVNKPVLFSGAYADLIGKPALFSGAYADLTGKPALFSGAYADLTGKPTIPTAVSQLTNDSGFITSSALSGYLLSSTAASTYQTKADMSGYLLSSTAASTYQTKADMSGYLLSSTAASTYQTKADMSGYLTTITSAQVTTALGYTPAKSTRVSSQASLTSPYAFDGSLYDVIAVNSLANALTINADSSTPTDGQKVLFRFKDNGTPRTITFTGGAAKAFQDITGALTVSGSNFTATTTANKSTYVGCVYNGSTSRWDVVAFVQQA